MYIYIPDIYQRFIYIYIIQKICSDPSPKTQRWSAETLQKLVSTTSASGVISQSTVKVKRSTSEDKQKKDQRGETTDEIWDFTCEIWDFTGEIMWNMVFNCWNMEVSSKHKGNHQMAW